MKLQIPFEFQVATMCKDFLDEVIKVVATCNIKWIRRRWIEIERISPSCYATQVCCRLPYKDRKTKIWTFL
jgi:hypothetical protein